MRYLPFIWANLWRKPTRTAFMLVSVVLGFTLWGLVLGFEANLRRIAESANADRIYIAARFGGRLAIAQMAQISRMRDIANVGALGEIGGYYRQPNNRVAVLMLGSGMREVFRDLPLTARQWEILESTREGVFVSRLFAIRYGLTTGSNFPVVSPNVHRADGSDVWSFNVLGVVPDISLMPVGFVVGNYDYLDQGRPLADRGGVQQFWVLAKDAAHTDDVAREIDDSFSSSAFPTRSVSEKAMLASAGGGGSDAFIALTAVALSGMAMVGFLTANALRHSIRHRTTEITVLKTMGFSNLRIMSLVLTEAAFPCLVGCFLGLAAAVGLAEMMPRVLPAAVALPVPRVDFGVVSSGIGAALLVAMIAGAMPALRIARLDVAPALARQ